MPLLFSNELYYFQNNSRLLYDAQGHFYLSVRTGPHPYRPINIIIKWAKTLKTFINMIFSFLNLRICYSLYFQCDESNNNYKFPNTQYKGFPFGGKYLSGTARCRKLRKDSINSFLFCHF